MTPQALINWIDTFFAEKDLDSRTYTVETPTDTHFIDTDFVVSLIRQASPGEQAQIKNVLVKIDFANGDVHHFLAHLAAGYVKTHY